MIHRNLTQLTANNSHENSANLIVYLFNFLANTLHSANFKSTGITIMQKQHCYCAGPSLQDVLNRRLPFKNKTGSKNSTKETITIIFSLNYRRCSHKTLVWQKMLKQKKKQKPANS
ncbi:hypothetical protein CEXT_224261 [Caerostris extrusa]|uniref:Uncharacterized protein n=1 Tax=Caerostris extrusa TaxID=172846 RepID=A0AAV4P5R1_CAEEX|nr:hypothetical protein CEXT_224261 [Caerostris extrusa]